jgi:hypothetical protein
MIALRATNLKKAAQATSEEPAEEDSEQQAAGGKDHREPFGDCRE